MKNKNFGLSILLLLFTFGLISCSSEKEIARKEKVIPAERLVVKLEANRRKIKTFHATGVITVNSPQVNSKFNFSVDYKKPDSLKLTAFGPFGIEIAQLLLTEDFFNYYDALGNTLYQGSNGKQISQKIFRIPLGFNELKNLLLGKADFTAVLRKKPTRYALENGAYVLHFREPESGFERRYVILKNNLSLDNFEIVNKKNEKVFSVVYSKFKKAKGGREPFPYKIRVESQAKNSVLEIEYHTVKINGNINDLRLQLPNDVTIKKL